MLQEMNERASAQLTAAVGERTANLQQDAQSALSHAFDAADIARLQDAARLHVLVDRTLGQVVESFAKQVAAAVENEYERAVADAPQELELRFSFSQAASAAFGSTGSSALWNEHPQQALAATIVLDAIGGPAIALVQAIAQRFASGPPGSYMKRELTADLRSAIWPSFAQELHGFGTAIASRLGDIAQSYRSALTQALDDARDAALGSIDRALRVDRSSQDALQAQIRANSECATHIETIATAIDTDIDEFLGHGEEIAVADAGSEAVRRSHVDAEFDREAYRRGLRPQRWRVAVLGALRRGKSSLINAFAGHRVLADEAAGAIAYPVHVRYGEQEGAFALQPDGTWQEVEIESALEEAARNPVLILTPWKLPKELVLVHAPAFDAGETTLEDVCVVAAREASEVLCLFSRQLSDRELSLYGRVAETGKPMTFVHTLADNESAAERRHVVQLASEYLRERAIPAQRIFTVSTLEYAQAKRERRQPAGWNELDALIATICAHAEEHMARLDRLQRAADAIPASASEQAAVAKPRSLFARMFGGG